jgi:hypothetical protein
MVATAAVIRIFFMRLIITTAMTIDGAVMTSDVKCLSVIATVIVA